MSPKEMFLQQLDQFDWAVTEGRFPTIAIDLGSLEDGDRIIMAQVESDGYISVVATPNSPDFNPMEIHKDWIGVFSIQEAIGLDTKNYQDGLPGVPDMTKVGFPPDFSGSTDEEEEVKLAPGGTFDTNHDWMIEKYQYAILPGDIKVIKHWGSNGDRKTFVLQGITKPPEEEKRKYKVFIARFPYGGTESHHVGTWLVQAVIAIKKEPLIDKVTTHCYDDTPITMTRNRAVQDARAWGADYLIMIDSDMYPDAYVPADPEAVTFWDAAWGKFMEHRQEEDNLRTLLASKGQDPELALEKFAPMTIAAPYCGPPPEEVVYVSRWVAKQSDHPNPDMVLEKYPRDLAATFRGLIPAHALPTGLIAYDMRTFDRLEPPYFAYEHDEPYHAQKRTTEDYYQTRNAAAAGMPQLCAWSSWAIHMKTKEVPRPGILTMDDPTSGWGRAIQRGVLAKERVHMVEELVGPLQEDPEAEFVDPDDHDVVDELNILGEV